MTTVHIADVVLPIVGEPIFGGAVVVDGDRVVAVGTVGNEYGEAKVRRHRGVLMPGLVNAHAHLEYGPPFADLATSGLAFPEWIRELTRRRRNLSTEQWTEAARGSALECLRHGTTAVADVVTNGPGIAVARRAGLRGTSYVEAVGADAPRWPAELARVEALLTDAGQRAGMSPHALYTLSSAIFGECVQTARARGMRIHTHLAESTAEVEYVLAATGPIAEVWRQVGMEFELLTTGGTQVTPTQHCRDLGGLGPDVHVAHGVHVDAGDREILREHHTVVALCPRSNAILQAGSAPVASYLAEGNLIAVGTDSLASAPSLDVMADVRELRDLAVAQGYAEPDLARRLVEAATLGGAQALGDPRLGRIAVGGPADLAVFDVPIDADPYESLVANAAGRCTATVLAGRLVHRGKVKA